MDWYVYISVGPGPSHYDRLATASAAHNRLTLGTREYSPAVAVHRLYQQQQQQTKVTTSHMTCEKFKGKCVSLCIFRGMTQHR